MSTLVPLISPYPCFYSPSLFQFSPDFVGGLAIMNPSAQRQITQYAASVTELFKLMTEGKESEFAERIHTAGKFVFGDKKGDSPRLLRDDLLDQFSLSGVPLAERVPNNQLALLAMVDCWWKLGLNPYDHMICSTPVSLPHSLG